jgi:hypothetical protein
VKLVSSRFRINLLEHWGLFAALLVAAAFSDVASPLAWKRIWAAITLWARLAKTGGKRVSPLQHQKRLLVCLHCPVYYAKLKTCGTPLVAELRDMGCWCFLPSKAWFAEATCWLEDELGEEAPHGWKKTLTSQK